MAIKGDFLSATITAGSDLSGLQYYVVALHDGNRAINGHEACGILQNKPKTGEAALVGYVGLMKYRAGGAITQGNKLAVDSNSTMIKAASGDLIKGEALNTVTSGSIGMGIFSFPSFFGVDSATAAS
ncbi:MAG TPA: DUF2190 family protein [Deltaproteobacteria bacterium]|nr:DUF2190 family protein [Deltaproteobacteria bacterium]